MLKRYIVFVYGFFSGCSGWSGAVGYAAGYDPSGKKTPPDSFDSIEEATEHGRQKMKDGFGEELVFQVVDLHTGLVAHEEP